MEFKKWTALILALAMAGCTAASAPSASDESSSHKSGQNEQVQESGRKEYTGSEEDQAFEKYLDEYVRELCSRSYITAHHYFTDYKKEGITLKDDAYTLGDFIPTEEDREFTQSVLDELKKINVQDLNETNRDIYEQLNWQYDLSQRTDKEEFLYLGSIWSDNSGTQSEIYNFFTEFQLYSEDDIPALIRLISSTPDYVAKAIEYTKEQAERKTLGFDLESVLSYCQDVLDNEKNSPVYTELDLEVDTLMLDDAKAREYKDQIHEALKASFFPAYQTIIDELGAMKDQIGPIQGLASYEHGKEYYDLVLEYSTSTDKSADELFDEVSDAYDDLRERAVTLLNSGFDPNSLDSVSTGFKSAEEILSFLEENYANAFPVVDDMQYELKALPPEQSQPGVVAYFLVPPIDSNKIYQMRYNERDYGQDPSDLNFFNTLAHEGIPGHMYQTQYEKEHFTSDAQYFLSSMAMQEGYATYAAEVAQSWLDIDPDLLEGSTLNEWMNNYTILQADIMINGDGQTVEEFEDIFGEGTAPLYNQLAQDPGTFFSYYYGYYLITQKKAEAMEELGSKFNEVDFNQALLKVGNLKFSIISDNIDDYIKEAKAS